jgi:hypothetical protein
LLMARGIGVEKTRPGASRELRSWGKKPVGLESRPPPEELAPDASEAATVEGGGASPSPVPQAPPNKDSAAELPPIAAKADDLEAIRKAVDDAAAVSGALWFSYLFALFYFAVAAGA